MATDICQGDGASATFSNRIEKVTFKASRVSLRILDINGARYSLAFPDWFASASSARTINF